MVKLEFCKLSPIMILTLFTLISILLFIDRGAFAAVLQKLEKKIHGGLGLSSSQAGLAGSLFALGVIISSPIASYLSQYIHPQYLISAGLFIWSGAVFLTFISKHFLMLGVARLLVGFGEGFFICLAPPFIIDCAPVEKRTKWIGIYYSAQPLGMALGIVYGTQISNLFKGWHYPFIFETVVMIPFMLTLFLSYKDPKHYAKKEGEEREKFTTALRILFGNYLYLCLVIGYSAYGFTTGGLAFWTPYFVESFYHISGSIATYSLGANTMLCGIIGTRLGSYILSRIMKKYEDMKKNDQISNEKLECYRVEKSSWIMLTSIFIGLIITVLGLLFSSFLSKPGNFIVFFIGLVFGEFLFAITIAPTAIAIMMSVPIHLRGHANSISMFFMHSLGGLPSHSIIGAWFDNFGEYVGILLTFLWLIISVVFWGIAWNASVIDI
ncbi:hypothetical protein SteCoe_20989 [Stentor coeruleus]|uniref:Major facilitator superfamily (MFS) profile domain-containing protein n=1 Tax=Stentor coeruleus TaxID=5963 RepID=A0A1R2BQK5_9CILI|nr:hypothetical protein SteCoe_20989 [Stentor coeruleus]